MNEDKSLIPDNFIHEIIDSDLKPEGRFENAKVHTRFPPEPNGYLHIGHAKAIFINFETAKKYDGLCNLRMDDTNPIKEDTEYVQAIKEDIKWLGYDWGDRFFHASDYFQEMYDFACELIEKGLAFVCELNAEQIRESRGTLTTPATPSPYRDRPPSESLALFEKMKNGEFEDGEMTLRAKIDLNSGNFNMRDPVLYRISKNFHHRTGNDWCIYPMYDFAHPLEDALEGITHSLCSLEFEDHRPLYDWVIKNTSCKSEPRQIEFARLNISHTVMSKRKLARLVSSEVVDGWDDPRMPTLCGLRRRGYTPESIKNFCARIGVSKVYSTVDYALLEHCLREHLNKTARRIMAVINPVKLLIENYPEGKTETFEIENNPERPEDGKREISFSRELWIEREDFMETKKRKFFRLYPGNEVRLKTAYIIKCVGVKKDESGKITEILATYDPLTKGGSTPDNRKIKGTIHWVNAQDCKEADVNLYDSLFTDESPDSGEKDFLDLINPASLEKLSGCKIEGSVMDAVKETCHFQFMRKGYFFADKKHFDDYKPVFNRTVSLKDSYRPGGG